MADLTRTVKRLTAPLQRRMVLMIGRAIIRMVNDAHGHQRLQLEGLGGETMDGVERFQEYGFSSVPHAGASAVLGAVGGDRAHSIVMGVEDRRYRIRGMAHGEVAIHDDLGQVVHLGRDGIRMEGRNILMTTPGVLRLEGDGVEIHARRYVQTDVAGKGSRETWAGGTVWNTDSYTTGATGETTEHGLDQPDIPGGHPDHRPDHHPGHGGQG